MLGGSIWKNIFVSEIPGSVSLPVSSEIRETSSGFRFRYGCQSNDHRACDEICKQDSFWYGHCTAWDGRDFRCECHEYRPPLDKTPCIQKQHLCSDACKAQGLEGGYCYIHTVTNAETGAADCKCFDEIPIER
ncbi:unnamed protein product [Toxocara canis]|uniref:Defensin-like protein n=1 Tax=Toxocara canis TaxID=6265 RepID=A0A183UEQ8_TOXCA|nr:unnamed protein product [Toxocara canis]